MLYWQFEKGIFIRESSNGIDDLTYQVPYVIAIHRAEREENVSTPIAYVSLPNPAIEHEVQFSLQHSNQLNTLQFHRAVDKLVGTDFIIRDDSLQIDRRVAMTALYEAGTLFDAFALLIASHPNIPWLKEGQQKAERAEVLRKRRKVSDRIRSSYSGFIENWEVMKKPDTIHLLLMDLHTLVSANIINITVEIEAELEVAKLFVYLLKESDSIRLNRNEIEMSQRKGSTQSRSFRRLIDALLYSSNSNIRYSENCDGILNLKNLEEKNENEDENCFGIASLLNSINMDNCTHPIKIDNYDILQQKLLSTPYHFQLQGLQWMLSKEKKEKVERLNPLYDELVLKDSNEVMYVHRITGEFSQFAPPSDYGRKTNTCGGMICDEVGLGKTLQVLMLIAAHHPPNNWFERLPTEQIYTSQWIPIPVRSTLIVVPGTLLKQWQSEVVKHFLPDALSVAFYFGPNSKVTRKRLKLNYGVDISNVMTGRRRSTLPNLNNEILNRPIAMIDDLLLYAANGEKYQFDSGFPDIIFTTYETLKTEMRTYSNDIFCREEMNVSPLSQLGFFRLVLDEAQVVSKANCVAAQMCSSIYRRHAWIVTATPIQSQLSELQGLFEFLGLDLFAICQKNLIEKKYGKQSILALKRMQSLLKEIMLRRSKSQRHISKELKLPDLQWSIRRVSLSSTEYSLYKKAKDSFVALLHNVKHNSKSRRKKKVAFGKLLAHFTRLRQSCNHPQLVKELDSFLFGKERLSISSISRLLIQNAKYNWERKILKYLNYCMMSPISALFEHVIAQYQLLGKTAIEQDVLAACFHFQSIKIQNCLIQLDELQLDINKSKKYFLENNKEIRGIKKLRVRKRLRTLLHPELKDFPGECRQSSVELKEFEKQTKKSKQSWDFLQSGIKSFTTHLKALLDGIKNDAAGTVQKSDTFLLLKKEKIFAWMEKKTPSIIATRFVKTILPLEKKQRKSLRKKSEASSTSTPMSTSTSVFVREGWKSSNGSKNVIRHLGSSTFKKLIERIWKRSVSFVLKQGNSVENLTLQLQDRDEKRMQTLSELHNEIKNAERKFSVCLRRNRQKEKFSSSKSDLKCCPICLEILQCDFVVTSCDHAFCSDCIHRHFENNGETNEEEKSVRCPVCRSFLKSCDLFDVFLDEEEESKRNFSEHCGKGNVDDAMLNRNEFVTSAKLEAVRKEFGTKLYEMILACIDARKKDKNNVTKILIFSAWKSMLELALNALHFCDFDALFLRGTLEEKANIVDIFQAKDISNSNIQVLLIPLFGQLGAAGLNLTAAKTVILLEPALQSGIELQAVGRCHRIGSESKCVSVIRILAENTIENRILELQQRRLILAAGVRSIALTECLEIKEIETLLQ
eukprot:g6064.t1